jgi:hypothetical protein
MNKENFIFKKKEKINEIKSNNNLIYIKIEEKILIY